MTSFSIKVVFTPPMVLLASEKALLIKGEVLTDHQLFCRIIWLFSLPKKNCDRIWYKLHRRFCRSSTEDDLGDHVQLPWISHSYLLGVVQHLLFLVLEEFLDLMLLKSHKIYHLIFEAVSLVIVKISDTKVRYKPRIPSKCIYANNIEVMKYVVVFLNNKGFQRSV